MTRPSPSETPLVLLADRDRVRAERIRRPLEERGAEILEVDAPTGVLSALQAHQGAHALLLDLGMLAGATGLSLDRLQFVAPTLAVVVVARDEERAGARSAVSAGAQGYLLDSQLQPALVYRTVAHAVAQRQVEVDRDLAEGALLESRGHYQTLFDLCRDAVCVVDAHGVVLDANPAALELLGGVHGEVLGRVADTFLARAEDRERVRAALASREAVADIDVPIHGATGSDVWVALSMTPRESVLGRARESYVSFHDLSGRPAPAVVTREGFYDPLTHLPNRSLLLDRLNQLLSRHKRHNEFLFAVLFMDLDRFKDVNDRYGHGVGDDLLQEVAARLLEAVRDEDTVARIGGDEFIILLGQIDAVEDAMFIADRILDRVGRPFPVQAREIPVSCSIGIALATPNAALPEELLRQADYAMYEAKNRGRGKYQIYDRAMQAQVMRTLRLDAELRRAVAEQQFVVYYQPVVEAETGRVRSFEALVRWKHPQRGLIPSSDFIPVAEERGFVKAIGNWVLGEVCRQIREWRDEYPASKSVEISINLSTAEFLRPDLVDDVEKALRKHGVPPHRLRFELKESTLAADPALTLVTFQRLRQLGIRVSIDDFGQGSSSPWSYLSDTPVDSLKAPQASAGGQQREGRIGIERVARLAQCLGMHAVAEAVETEQELQTSRAAGSRLAQGNFFWAPLEAAAAAALLKETPRQ